MHFVTDALTVVAGVVICWWAMALAGMFFLTVFKYLIWFWWLIG